MIERIYREHPGGKRVQVGGHRLRPGGRSRCFFPDAQRGAGET
jgi:hypothetical protein